MKLLREGKFIYIAHFNKAIQSASHKAIKSFKTYDTRFKNYYLKTLKKSKK